MVRSGTLLSILPGHSPLQDAGNVRQRHRPWRVKRKTCEKGAIRSSENLEPSSLARLAFPAILAPALPNIVTVPFLFFALSLALFLALAGEIPDGSG
jgi:hypothetical protein